MKHKHYQEYKRALSLALPPNKLEWGNIDNCPLCAVSEKYTPAGYNQDELECKDCPCNLYMRAIFNPEFYPDQQTMFPCAFLQSFQTNGFMLDMNDAVENFSGWPGFERILVEVAYWYELTQKYEGD